MKILLNHFSRTLPGCERELLMAVSEASMTTIVYSTDESVLPSDSGCPFAWQKLGIQAALEKVAETKPRGGSRSLFVLSAADPYSSEKTMAVLRCCAQQNSAWATSAHFIVHINSAEDVGAAMALVIPKEWNQWGRLKIVLGSVSDCRNALDCWINAVNPNEFRWVHSAPMTRDFFGKNAVWMCNFNDTTAQKRLEALRAAHSSAIEVPMKLGPIRYSLATSILPPDFRVLLFVHRTEWTVDMLINDIKQMQPSTLDKLLFCLYSGGGAGQADLARLRLCLSPGRVHCLELPAPPDKCESRDLKQIVDSYITDASRDDDGWQSVDRLAEASDPIVKANFWALSILCQGYIAVHDPNSLDLDARIQEVLRTHSATSKVDDPWWWMAAFDESADKRAPGALEAAVNSLRLSIETGWTGDPAGREPIDELLNALLAGRSLASIVQPAWSAINENLGILKRSVVKGQAVQ